MKTRVKICGLRRPEDIQYVNAAMPDYIGYVFAKSRRQITLEQAEELNRLLHPDIVPVGVFVNADPEEIKRIAAAKAIGMIQLHGQESPDYAREIRESTGLPVIKAVSVTDRNSILEYQDFPSDYLLLDKGAGGTGSVFSWNVLEEARKAGFSRRIFLAGGLKPENVRKAAAYHPWCLDVSSGVETDGFKDGEKISRFMELAGKDE